VPHCLDEQAEEFSQSRAGNHRSSSKHVSATFTANFAGEPKHQLSKMLTAFVCASNRYPSMPSSSCRLVDEA